MRSRSDSRNSRRSSSTRGPAVRRSGGGPAGRGATCAGRQRAIAAEITCAAGRDRKRSNAWRNSSADANAGKSISPRARAIRSSSGPGTRNSASRRPNASSRWSRSAYCPGVAGTASAARGRCTVPSPRTTICSGRLGGSDQPRRSATASVRATASSGVRAPASAANSASASACCSCPMPPLVAKWGPFRRERKCATNRAVSASARVVPARSSRQTTANVDTSGAKIASADSAPVEASATRLARTRNPGMRPARGSWVHPWETTLRGSRPRAAAPVRADA